MNRLRRVPLLALAPVLAFIALLAWAFASPIGAGPDDDYHLVSSWCAGPTAAETCAPVEGAERADHRIPRALDAMHEMGVDLRRKKRAAAKKRKARK